MAVLLPARLAVEIAVQIIFAFSNQPKVKTTKLTAVPCIEQCAFVENTKPTKNKKLFNLWLKNSVTETSTQTFCVFYVLCD